MPISDRVLLRCSRGYRLELDALVAAWMQEGVKYVGVLGVDASKVEDIIDELCVGDGSNPNIVRLWHEAPESTRYMGIGRLGPGSRRADDLGPAIDGHARPRVVVE